jgi:chemotaxis protein MotB
MRTNSLTLIKLIVFASVISGILFSCVPARKFEDVKAANEACEKERENLNKQNESLTTANNELKATIARYEREMAALIADTAMKSNTNRILTMQYDKISELYKQLLENQQKLRADADNEQQKAMQMLQKTRDELQVKEDELRNLEARLNQERASLEAMKTINEQKERELNEKNALLESQRNELSSKNSELDSKNAKVAELQAILNAKDSAMNALRTKVSEALSGFEGNGLTVTQKEGKVYVSLDEKLLFKSGKWDVDPKGQEALKKLAAVLENNHDVNITIEGHTDDLAYSGNGNIQDNWDLSTKRATSIVKIILSNSKIDPVRLIASGRSCYLPVDDAKTAEARAKNRRTEIILTPKLDVLYELTK